jgi:hypothetical protein
MQKHQPKPDGASAKSFYLYIANQLNSTAGMNVVHNALYSRNYAKYAELSGISYTTYYTGASETHNALFVTPFSCEKPDRLSRPVRVIQRDDTQKTRRTVALWHCKLV